MGNSKILGKDIRTVLEIGDSLFLCIPKKYTRAHNIKKGDKLTVYYDDILHIEPVTDKEILKKLYGK